MSPIQRFRSRPLGRAGLVTGCAIALFFGFNYLSPPAGSAAVPALTAHAVAGFQTTDKLFFTVQLPRATGANRQGTLRLELLDASGRVLAGKERAIDSSSNAVGTYQFELPAVKKDPAAYKLRGSFGNDRFEVPLPKVLVVKAHETSLATGREFHAGSTAALRCGVHGVKSMTETVPLIDATVDVQLRSSDGKTYALHSGKTAADGWDRTTIHVPAVPAGSYTLVVATKSAFGQEKLEQAVQVKSEAKVLLVTDKPLYQPGQTMHIRALALRPIDLKPVDGRELMFEVEDAKGNKVFKRSIKISEFGIAALDFQLADEVNMGDYHVRALLEQQTADKTVSVKRYVLPKFKTNVTADKASYLPKETVHAEVQTDYFFGKPVGGAAIEVTASTFDVAFRSFHTWKGKTDAQGHVKFDITLPDYFVGQPLQKGNALLRLEVKATDTADHTETVNRTFPVSEQPIRVSLIPEGGRLVPDMENRVFAAATYPDGSPALCNVKVWTDKEKKGEPIADLKTNAAGLAEFCITPKAGQFRQGPWEQRNVEMLGGQVINAWLPKLLFDLSAEARDGKGSTAHAVAELTGDMMGDNILLRLDKAIYQAGESLVMHLHSSAGMPTAYLDIVRGGQTMLTRWLDVKDGQTDYRLDLPPEAFGTLEIHAYQVLQNGAIIRDSRVAYVQPRSDLKIDMKADKDVYAPGETGKIRFLVTDTSGNPTAAALGVVVVDESVYALQEMQPGLEKVYFTLQQELLKPQAQIVYQPHENIETLVRRHELEAAQQQVAEVLLTTVRPKPPGQWAIDRTVERRRQADGQLQQIGWALLNYSYSHADLFTYDKQAKRWFIKPSLLQEMTKANAINSNLLKDPLGHAITLEGLAHMDPEFSADHLAEAITWSRMQQVFWAVANYTNAHRAQFFTNGQWGLPDSVLIDAIQHQKLGEAWQNDAWGRPFKLFHRDRKIEHQTGLNQFDYYELISAGPDGKFDTDDDVRFFDSNYGRKARRTLLARRTGLNRNGMLLERLGEWRDDRALRRLGALPMGGPGGFQGGFGRGFPGADGAVFFGMAEQTKAKAGDRPGLATATKSGSVAPTRIREFFPETMLWQPALITDSRGVGELPVDFADSITTWRLSASASSKSGALGGTTGALRVFQDFFVDIDLPVSLTRNDEVAFPVAVYNYLKTPQTVTLDLTPEPWFELTDGGGLTRTLDLKPNEVTSVKFRIRAGRIGFQPLTIEAQGSKRSDAVKRTVEVVPDGRKVEQVITDRLQGTVTQTMTIPDHALADSSKLMVTIYPGIMSQVLEGTEGMLRLPGG